MHTNSRKFIMPAKRKLNFIDSKTLQIAKKVRTAVAGTASKTKQSFAKKVKSIVLRNTETKIINGATAYEQVAHNGIYSFTGTIGNAASKSLNCMRNLTYCEVGDGGFQRDGEKIHAKHIDVQMLFQTPGSVQGSGTDSLAYSNNVVFRVVVWECNRAETATGTQIPSDVFSDTYLYVEPIGPSGGGAGSQGNYLQANFNSSKYRLLKDFIITNGEQNQWDAAGTAIPVQYYKWTSTLKLVRFRIPINKTIDYGDPSSATTTTVPNRVIQMAIMPYNHHAFSNGSDIVSVVKVTHQMSFKDI